MVLRMTNNTTIQRLSHIGICVSNLDRSIAFYRDVFGYEVVSTIKIGPEADALLDLKNTKLDAVYMQRPDEDTRIELLYYHSPGFHHMQEPRQVNLTGLTHLSFRTSNFDAVVSAAINAGCTYLVRSATHNPAYKMKAGFILDPDQLRIELLEAPGDPDFLPGQKPKRT